MKNHNDYISIRGARVHNLKNIDVDIPRDSLVVITGVSGSGKSSLAFDTIFAEGQRRYIESLSSYARQFLEQIQKPDVDHIEGVPPTIAIEQRTVAANPRSTVATVTEIYDYLRLLFAKVGTPYCHQCSQEVTRQSAEDIIDKVMQTPLGTRIMLLAPVIKGKKGEHKEVFEAIKKEGFVRARVNGLLLDITQPIRLSRYKTHSIEVLVDRLVLKADIQSRLYDSIQTCLEVGEGIMVLSQEKRGNWQDTLFSQRYACRQCGIGLEELAPRLFSFNSPYGACPQCEGLGSMMELDPDLIIPHKDLTLRQGALEALRNWGKRTDDYYGGLLKDLSKNFPSLLDTPFKKLPKGIRETILYGTKGDKGYFEGVLPILKDLYERTEREAVKRRLESYMSEHSCLHCGGARLRPEALAVKIGKKNISELTAMDAEKALAFFRSLSFSGEKALISREVLKEIIGRLGLMIDLGLGYLTLDRTSTTLSGGEAQRLRLATQVGSGLVGVCYVLDEPTIGLHARDGKRLITSLKSLRDTGNTVIVVEHDEETIRNADYIVDLGPGAGDRGGRVVTHGSLEEVLRRDSSLTASYLRQDLRIALPSRRRKVDPKNCIEIRGARENNLKSINVKIPLGVFCCVTGVSGSGKSTLVDQILHRALARVLYRSNVKPGAHDSMVGIEKIDKVIEIDQSPIGRTPRSNSVTYTNVFTQIREVFSQTRESRLRGYGPGRFSFNVKGGRCKTCEGQGTKKLEMHFLPDTFVTCDQCKGKRYNNETLEILYKEKNIADVLAMRVEEAYGFFRNIPKIERTLRTLRDVGLGYMTLGQPSTTLSGGEAQRVKLSTELAKHPTGRTLYILDEPTTGLHFADIENLLKILNRLVDMGNTVVVIEHHLDVVKQADCIIDLGPEGGDEGGWVVATGSPEEVVRCEKSYTGRALRKYL
ncbi:MAG: excinuclease ABC subunit UvrA [Candidatus Brocadiales bacterium]|nr:excinuclease ABC subunit UvrA [Candidatus Brocadiales bacterium]